MTSSQNQAWWLRFLDKTHITVTGLTAVMILLTRSAGVAYFAAGALACSQSAKVVKMVIKQPRPVSPYSHKKTYGMPSTHSAAIAFYATYITFASFALPTHHSLISIPLIRLAPLITTPWAATIIASRVWLGHHTWEQVAAGCAYGFCWSILWFSMWTNGLNQIGGLVEHVVESYVRGT